MFKILIEPIYVFIFNKPFTVHFYLFPKNLSKSHKEILSNHFTFYNKLQPKYQKYFDHRVVRLINDLNFVSRENIEITSEMKLLISATSIILTFGMQKYLYSGIRNIVIYPSSFLSNGNLHLGEYNPKLKTLVFSWQDFYTGIKIENNNLNLGIHEFSHALLFESTQKIKFDATSCNYIFSDYYNEIIKDLKTPEFRHSLINSNYFRAYAFVNSAEFIAVILEHFFETPEKFNTLFPELFLKVKKMINYNEKYFINS